MHTTRRVHHDVYNVQLYEEYYESIINKNSY